MRSAEGCPECKFYLVKGDVRSCEWFESRISKIFPRWIQDFRLGKLRFYSCGFFEKRG
jgi:hypothetical protein